MGAFHDRCELEFGSYLTVLEEYDLRNTQSIEESVRHSDIVYNLVGRQYPTKYVIARGKKFGSSMSGPFDRI